MRVLYIGGTGEISYACVHASVALGHEVAVFNRGRSEEPLPDDVEQITGDLNDEAAYAALAEGGYDVVCQYLAFDVDRIEKDIEVFGGKCGQYVFISSASAYQKPPRSHIITESTPLENPFWEYSAKKARMEVTLFEAHAAGRINATVVRPSHTFRCKFPGTFVPGDHNAWRILNGKPIIIHGDGTSLWTLTRSEDFAEAFVRLLGNDKASGEAFHITSDETNMWNVIFNAIGDALGKQPEIVHIATDTLVRYNESWAGPLLGDKACPVAFDNTKVKQAVGGWTCKHTMAEGMTMAAPHVLERLKTFKPDGETEALLDQMIEEQRALGK